MLLPILTKTGQLFLAHGRQITVNNTGEYILTVIDEATDCKLTRTFSVVLSNTCVFELEIEELYSNNSAEVIILFNRSRNFK